MFPHKYGETLQFSSENTLLSDGLSELDPGKKVLTPTVEKQSSNKKNVHPQVHGETIHFSSENSLLSDGLSKLDPGFDTKCRKT